MTEQLALIDIDEQTPRERGRHHGEATRDLIAQSLEHYARSFALTHGLDWSGVTERALMWVPIIERHAPDLLAEMSGIAEGANCALVDIVALNARGEIVYDTTFQQMIDDAADVHTEEDGCTSFVILPEATSHGHVYTGQNWDWRVQAQSSVVAMRIRQPGKPTIVMQTEAGQIGRQGANSAGIALNANGLGGRFSGDIALPQTVIRRLILESDSYYDALNVPFSLRQQIPANLVITDRSGFTINLETTPARHRWLYASEGILVHANHYEEQVPDQIAADYRPFSVDSLFRSPILRGRLRSAAQAMRGPEPSLLMDCLGDHFGHPFGVCRHADGREPEHLQSKTIASAVVDLTSGRYFLARGNPCETAYELLPWNLYDDDARPRGGVSAAHTTLLTSSGRVVPPGPTTRQSPVVGR